MSEITITANTIAKSCDNSQCIETVENLKSQLELAQLKQENAELRLAIVEVIFQYAAKLRQIKRTVS